MSNALEIKELTKHFSGFTLDRLSLTLPSGCVMGFIGENGAGKSTTIKLILGLLKKDGGEISVLGSTLSEGGKELRERIGVVMDECNFPEMMTLRNIGKMMQKCYRTWDAGKFARYQREFDLPQEKMVKEFSRGMKMKLSIAAALSHDSRLLILDEPTSGLDPVVRDEILDIFLDFIQDENHSIFLSSHIISDLEKICDYIALLHRGRLVFSEEKNELLERYVILKGGAAQLQGLDPRAVVGVRENSFGVEALARRELAPAGLVQEPASLEDIMLYHIKSERHGIGTERGV